MLAVIAHIRVTAGNVQRQGLKHRRLHLAGQEAHINQLVQIVLLPGQKGLYRLRRLVDIGRTNGLVGVLGIFTTLVLVWRFGAILIAILGLNKAAGSRNGLLRHADAVGTDIGNQTHGSGLA